MTQLNDLISQQIYEILHHPEQWQYLSLHAPSDVQPVSEQRYANWLKNNSGTHAYAEMMLALEGESYFGLGEMVYPCQPGLLVCIHPFDQHDSHYPLFSPECIRLWITLLPHHIWVGICRMHDGFGEAYVQFTFDWISVGISPNIFDNRYQHEAQITDRETIRIHDHAIAMMIIAYVLEVLAAPEKYKESRATITQIIASIQNYIVMFLDTPTDISQLAQISGYSTFHLHHLFKAHTGMTIQTYRNLCRLAKVKEMQALGCSQKEISIALGFSCPASFSRWYKRYR